MKILSIQRAGMQGVIQYEVNGVAIAKTFTASRTDEEIISEIKAGLPKFMTSPDPPPKIPATPPDKTTKSNKKK